MQSDRYCAFANISLCRYLKVFLELIIAHYRLLMLDHTSDVSGFSTCEGNTEAAAMAAARAWLTKHPAVEIWDGPKLVATLTNSVETMHTRQFVGPDA